MTSTDYDVLIIGAGVAGLNAGRLLAEAGRHVAIVEARGRVGGRIWTQTIFSDRSLPPIPVELGAEFVHGLPPATWSLIKEAGLSTIEIDGLAYRYDGSRLTAANEHGQQNAAEHVLEAMTQWMQRQPAGNDISFIEYLEAQAVDPLAARAASNYVEGFNAADQRRISVAALAKQQLAEDAIAADRLFRLEAGYAALPNFLAEKFTAAGGELILEAPVKKIAWKRGAVSVRASRPGGDDEYRSNRAVITVPLGVLQAQSIEFVPRPAEVLLHANRLKMGAVVHMTFAFKQKFWEPQLSFLFAPAESPPTWWTPAPDEVPLLTAWAGGPKAEQLLKLITADGDAGALCDLSLSTLAKIFALPLSEIRQLLSSWHVHNWQSDQYARGAYSYVQVGALDAPGKMRVPVEDTLYFAGEHTDVAGHWGTVHAALAAGAAAADQIIADERVRGLT
ncbi:MAG TPA: NAD(P)/FAD-dependent oxidoreductase [Steroidobacteraceae bacterium]